jgi:hypothetical protein
VLRDFREGKPRDTSVVLAGGERRCGMTFALLACTVATAIDAPRSVSWVVTKSARERDEIEQMIRGMVPPAWYQHRKAPEHS